MERKPINTDDWIVVMGGMCGESPNEWANIRTGRRVTMACALGREIAQSKRVKEAADH